MKRPGLLVGLLAVILLLCVGAVIADQQGLFGRHGGDTAPTSTGHTGSGTSGSSDPYGGIK